MNLKETQLFYLVIKLAKLFAVLKDCTRQKTKRGIPDDPKKYSRLTKHQTIGFCSITSMYLDSESTFINLDLDTSTSQIQ